MVDTNKILLFTFRFTGFTTGGVHCTKRGELGGNTIGLKFLFKILPNFDGIQTSTDNLIISYLLKKIFEL